MTEHKKRNTAIAVEPIEGGLRFVSGHGKTATLRFNECPEPIRNAAMAWGLARKVVNAAAMPCDVATGKPPTVMEKWAAVEAMVARMLQPDGWSERAGTREGDGGLLAQALFTVTKGRQPLAAIAATLAGMTPAQRTALRTQNPAVVEELGKMALARAMAAPAVGDELLAMFGGDEG